MVRVGGFGNYAAGLPTPKIGVSTTPMSDELVQQLDEYRRWAISNKTMRAAILFNTGY